MINTATTYEHTATRHVLYRCKACKNTYRRTFQVRHRAVDNQHPEYYLRRTYHYYAIDGGREVRGELTYPAHVCACGRTLYGRPVEGSYSERHTCGARCRNAKGPSCECSCAGENHGAGYQVGG